MKKYEIFWLVSVLAVALLIGCSGEEEYLDSMVVPPVEERDPEEELGEPEPGPVPDPPIYTPNTPSMGASGQLTEPYQQTTVSHTLEPPEIYCVDLRTPGRSQPNCFGPRLYIRDRNYHRSIERHDEINLNFIERPFLVSEWNGPKTYTVPADQEDPVVFFILDGSSPDENRCYPYSYVLTVGEGSCE